MQVRSSSPLVTMSHTLPDIVPRVRLIATRDSGFTTIFALARTPDGIWSLSDARETTEGVAHALPGASYVLDLKTGAHRAADRAGLVEVMHTVPEDAAKGTACWVVAGARGVKTVLDITGERIARAEWPGKAGKVENVAVVKKNSRSPEWRQASEDTDCMRAQRRRS